MKIFSLLILLPLFLHAQHDYESQDDHSSEHHYNHHAGAFLGATSGVYDGAETGFTVGLEYEYMMNSTIPILGIGGFFEAVMFEETEFIVGIPIYVHPYKGFKFFVSPNMIFREEHEPTELIEDKHGIQFLSGEEGNVIHSSNKFFIRMGAGYDFHFDNFSVSPMISFDLIESHSYLVYGVGFGFLF